MTTYDLAVAVLPDGCFPTKSIYRHLLEKVNTETCYPFEVVYPETTGEVSVIGFSGEQIRPELDCMCETNITENGDWILYECLKTQYPLVNPNKPHIFTLPSGHTIHMIHHSYL